MVNAFLEENPGNKNVATWWAAHAIEELASLGIRHLVISPGSRSTPLTMAASVHPTLRTHVVLDERSAAFTALGMGRATGQPAALICTSGTAAANYFPAVVEARQSGIPLLLLTADRPPNLRQIGASQAIDQIKLFGDYAVFFHEVGEPQKSQDDTQRLRIAVDQAFENAIGIGGPAHLNFPFRKPLEPEAKWLKNLQTYWNTLSSTPKPVSTSFRNSITSIEWPIEIREQLKCSQRPLFVAGPQRPFDNQTTALAHWAQAMNAPLLVDAGAQPVVHPNVISGFEGWLRSEYTDSKWQPDLIIRLGDQPVSKALELAFREWECPILQLDTRDTWQDATLNGGLRWRIAQLPKWAADLTISSNSDWLTAWKEQGVEWATQRDQLMDQSEVLTDGHIYHHVLNSVDDKQVPLHGFVSNSFPVRDITLFGPTALPMSAMHVTRGASGIDGITSAAIGATIASEQAGVLFIGDLAFLHDANALLQQSEALPPLLIIVLNNGGGDIFKMLPIQDHPEQFETYFKTPQQADIGKLCAAHQVPHLRITTLNELREYGLTDLLPEHGLRVVECQTHSNASMALRHRLWGMT